MIHKPIKQYNQLTESLKQLKLMLTRQPLELVLEHNWMWPANIEDHNFITEVEASSMTMHVNLQTLILYRTFVLPRSLWKGQSHLPEIPMCKLLLSIVEDQAHLLAGKPAVVLQQQLPLKQVMQEHSVPCLLLMSVMHQQ